MVTVFVVLFRWRKSHINEDSTVAFFESDEATPDQVEDDAVDVDVIACRECFREKWPPIIAYLFVSMMTFLVVIKTDQGYAFVPWVTVAFLCFYLKYFWTNPIVTTNARRITLRSDDEDEDEEMGIIESTIPDFCVSGSRPAKIGLSVALIVSMSILAYSIASDGWLKSLLGRIVLPMVVVVVVFFCGCKCMTDADVEAQKSRRQDMGNGTELSDSLIDHSLVLTESTADKDAVTEDKPGNGDDGYKAPLLAGSKCASITMPDNVETITDLSELSGLSSVHKVVGSSSDSGSGAKFPPP